MCAKAGRKCTEQARIELDISRKKRKRRNAAKQKWRELTAAKRETAGGGGALETYNHRKCVQASIKRRQHDRILICKDSTSRILRRRARERRGHRQNAHSVVDEQRRCENKWRCICAGNGQQRPRDKSSGREWQACKDCSLTSPRQHHQIRCQLIHPWKLQANPRS